MLDYDSAMIRNGKNRSLNMGRWEIERERFRIAEELPPAQDSGPETIGAILPGIMSRIKPKSSGVIFLIESKWADVAGKAAAHSKPAKLEKGVLTVYVDSSSWLSELSRFGKKGIKSGLDRYVGKDIVSDLHFVLDPD